MKRVNFIFYLALLLFGLSFNSCDDSGGNSVNNANNANNNNLVCGNNVIDTGEECDGISLNNKTCSDFGYSSGIIMCADNCTFDLSGCEGNSNNCLNTCTVGTARCNGEKIELCVNENGCAVWKLQTDCTSSNQYCDDSVDPPVCGDSCSNACNSGELRCSADNGEIEVCEIQSSGCTDWSLQSDCSASGKTCDDSSGTPFCTDNSSTGIIPPLGGSSGGSGGGIYPSGQTQNANGISYILIVPNTYNSSQPNRFMIVYSGTERASTMAQNLTGGAAAYAGLGDVIFAVLDGVTYNGNGQAGATVIDDVRSKYNIDNDRTFLLSESAGTTAGLELGFNLRQSYFAAYWANDVNASAVPVKSAAELGFSPWGNAGPGGDYADANTIVNAMSTKGYRLPADAPYSGAGSDTHGSTEQFIAALRFFDGKSRQ